MPLNPPEPGFNLPRNSYASLGQVTLLSIDAWSLKLKHNNHGKGCLKRLDYFNVDSILARTTSLADMSVACLAFSGSAAFQASSANTAIKCPCKLYCVMLKRQWVTLGHANPSISKKYSSNPVIHGWSLHPGQQYFCLQFSKIKKLQHTTARFIQFWHFVSFMARKTTPST